MQSVSLVLSSVEPNSPTNAGNTWQLAPLQKPACQLSTQHMLACYCGALRVLTFAGWSAPPWVR